jgi:glycine betaine/proline transport system substrate-binding protein
VAGVAAGCHRGADSPGGAAGLHGDPSAAALFATPQSGGHGQFLGGDPSWVQFDADIIRNLGLDFQVVFAGSEDAIISALETAVEHREPLLFYFWAPHPILTRFDLTRVALPPYSDQCYAKAAAGGIACDDPEEQLMKILRPGLRKEAPAAYQFLKSFNYSTADQEQMMEAVAVEGKTAPEAARQWIDAHQAVWQAWIPADRAG